MSDSLSNKILEHLSSREYRPQKPRNLAHSLNMASDEEYHAFRNALRELQHAGRVILGARGAVLVPTAHTSPDEFVGTYRHNRRGFGFVVPSDPTGREDLYIPEGQNSGAMTGDVVRARITSKGQRDGKAIYSGKITEILERTQKRFVGTLIHQRNRWMVLPDGNTLTEPILTPDAASRHVKAGVKVVVELTTYPETGQEAQGVITEILGAAGEKDVDLKSVIVQHNLPGKFPEDVADEARAALDTFDPERERTERLDLSDQIICTIDPDDAKDYDDAISLRRLDSGDWELGVHIADVSFFVPRGDRLDEEAQARGNSCYFPGYVIPMLPEVLSNGVCSLQEGVPRLCKSAFITYDRHAKPVATKFANTMITSAKRLRYREAQAIIDALEPMSVDDPPDVARYDRGKPVPHPESERTVGDYPPAVVTLLAHMNALARRLQKRRLAAGQLVLDLPEIELVLDENGKVVDAVPEDQSFTHTLIEMFMVEANEAVARLLDSLGVPFLRRIHPEPEASDSDRLRQFVQVAGFRLPKLLDRHALQALLQSVRGRPEGFAINLAVLKSLTRAEYSPKPLGHYALASEAYAHFTSPIRRYADLTIHRLLDEYLAMRDEPGTSGGRSRSAIRAQIGQKVSRGELPSTHDLMELGKHLSFTERRAEDAERELRQIKVLEMLEKRIGEEFFGVVTGITNFGIFIQLRDWLIDGLIRYENLLDDWWDVDERSGIIRGQRTGKRIGIGDVVKVIIVRVDAARRELELAVTEVSSRSRSATTDLPPKPHKSGKSKEKSRVRGGESRTRRKPARSTARSDKPKRRR
jgi:ribonuclease R